ncbi:hypothetical protein [Steroidobacter agaridevorans]|nr:hypothetical protein [Steroidobacter agaridevorans]
MSRVLLFAGWMLIGASAHAADEIESLDADFLEYLANLEADDDNWTLLDDPDREPASEDPEHEQSAKKPAARKSSKEAARPAVEER